jgi:hypothetical protein
MFTRPFQFLLQPFTAPKIHFGLHYLWSFLAGMLLLWSNQTQAQISIATFGAPATTDFNSLAFSFADPFYATGSFRGASNGSSTVGGLYHNGLVGSADRSFGAMADGQGTISYGVRYRNNTGQTITCLRVSFTIEQWSSSQNGSNTNFHNFSFRAGTVSSPLVTSLTSGFYTPFSDLDVVTVTNNPICGAGQTPINGNDPANQRVVTATITGISLVNGADIMLRWNSTDNTCADIHLAIDDLSVTAVTSPPPSGNTVINLTCNCATIDWNDEVGATLYEVQVDDDAGFGSPIGGSTPFSTTVSEKRICGLTPSTNYNYQIRTRGSCGIGPFRQGTFRTLDPPAFLIKTIPPFCSGNTPTVLVDVSVDPFDNWEIFWREGTIPRTVTGVGPRVNLALATTPQTGAITYTIDSVVNSSTGCRSLTPASAVANIVAVPSVPATITGPVGVCLTETPSYSVSSVAGVTYNWNVLPSGPSISPPTATGTSIAINWGTGPAGTYEVLVTPVNSCGISGSPQRLRVTSSACLPIDITCSRLSYSQNFDGAITPTLSDCSTPGNVSVDWKDNVTIEGWSAQQQLGTYRYNADDGNCDVGGLYSYGFNNTTERAIGMIQTGTNRSYFGARFRNNTGADIISLTISYRGEHWRRGVNIPGERDRLDFQYSTNATQLADGVWTDFDALDFPSIIISDIASPVNGNAINRIITSTIVLPTAIPDGSVFWVRWLDFDYVGANNDGLAVDNFSMFVNINAINATLNTIPNTCSGQAPDVRVDVINVPPGEDWRLTWREGVFVRTATGTGPAIGLILSTTPQTTSTLYELIRIENISTGCSTELSQNLTANILPAPFVPDPGSLSVCFGQSITVSLLPQTNVRYDWYRTPTESVPFFSGGSLLAGALTSSVEFYVSAVNTVDGCFSPTRRLIRVNVNPLPSYRVDSIVPVRCNGRGDGAIFLTPLSSGLTFNWIGGPSTDDYSGLIPGLYTVTVRNPLTTCFIQQSFDITQAPALTVTPTIQQVSCRGGNNGIIDLTVTGGTPGFRYQWSNTQTTQDIFGLSATQYCVTITDANNCVFNRCYDITQPALDLTASISDIDSTRCNGTSDGSITVLPNGGVSPYTFRWSTGPTTQTLAPVRADRYCVTVTDANNCTATICGDVPEPGILAINLVNFRNVSCFGLNDGIINIDVTGGNPPYNYDWTDLLPVSDAEDRQQLFPGPYCVNVRDSLGCTATRCFTVTEPTNLQATVTLASPPICHNGADGVIDISVNGGRFPYRYYWTRNNAFFSRDQDLFNVPAGNYTVVISDADSLCTRTLIIPLENPRPIETTLASKDDVRCFNGTDGAIRIDVSGGNPGYNYRWSNTATTEDIENLVAGNYCITVIDTRGCPDSLCVTITQPTELLLRLTAKQNVNCSGDSTGQLTVVATGGIEPYQFLWSNGQRLPIASRLTVGRHCVTVTDANGCAKVLCDSIAGNSSLAVRLVAKGDPTCVGTASGFIDIDVIGGVPISVRPFYDYNWTRNNVTYGTTEQDLSLLIEGFYCVTVTDAVGCQRSLCQRLSDPSSVVTRLVSKKDIRCFGGNDGRIDLETSGGASGYIYTWSNPTLSGASVRNLTAGTYTVSVSDANGCDTTLAITLTQPPKLVVRLASTTEVTCFGGTDGTVSLQVFGGTPAYRFRWSDTSTLPTLPAVRTGTYSVTVTDDSLCVDSLVNINVVQPTLPIIIQREFKIDNRCFGQRNGAIGITVSGGTPPYRYEWTDNFITEDISSLPAKTYCVTVTDSRGCAEVRCETVTQPTTLVATVVNVQPLSCNGTTDAVISVNVNGGSQPYTYNWGNGISIQNRTGLGPGTYCVTVTDRNGCRTTACGTVAVVSPLVVNVDSSRDARCEGSSTGGIFISVSGGVLPYQYLWNPTGTLAEDIVNIPAGTYTVTVTDARLCQVTRIVTIGSLPELNINVLTRNVSCSDGSNGEILTTVSGGSPPYRYFWTQAPTNPDRNLSGLRPGCYDLTVTDTAGCILQRRICLTAPDTIVSTLVSRGNVGCNGQSNGSLELAVRGGTPGYRFRWSTTRPQDTTARLTDIGGGSYFAIIRDRNNCLHFSDTFQVREDNPLRLTINFNDPVRCPNARNGRVGFQVEGGVQRYTYRWSTGDTTEEINNIPAGDYCFTVTDAVGCRLDTCVTVGDAIPLAIEVVTIVNESCGGANKGGAQVNVSGGRAPYTYLWSNASQDVFINDVSAGPYCVSVTDNLGCIDSLCLEILRNETPTVTFELIDSIICRNTPIINLIASPAGGLFSGVGVVGNTFDPSIAGVGTFPINYTYGEDGCVVSITRNMRIRSAPGAVQITVGGSLTPPAFCSDNNVQYPLGYFRTLANNTATFFGNGVVASGGRFFFKPADAGNGLHEITLNLRDNFTRCDTNYTISIRVNSPIVMTLSTNQANVCRGDQITITAFGADRYDWSPPVELDCGRCAGVGSVVVARPSTNRTYTVSGIVEGCRTSQTVRLNVVDSRPINITVTKREICAGDSTTLTASSQDNNSYFWSGGLVSLPNGNQIVVKPSINTTYTVSALNPNGCIIRQSIEIVVRPAQVLVSALNDTICLGNSTQLLASSTQPGVFNFIWSPSTGLSSTRGASVRATPTQTTTYTVTRSGTGNCRNAAVTVTVINNRAQLSGLSRTGIYCTNGPCVTLAGTPAGGTFDVNNASVTSFCPATFAPGRYLVRYSGTIARCPFLDTISVRVSNPIAARLVGFRPNYCQITSSVELTPAVAGATLSCPTCPAGALVGNTFSPSTAGAGTFTINVTAPLASPLGCFRDTTYAITVSPTAVALINMESAYCNQAASFTLTGSPVGGQFSGAGVRETTPGVYTFDPTILPLGNALVTYSGVSGPCAYSITREIRIVSPPTLRLVSTRNATSQFIPDGQIIVSGNGGVAPLEFSLNGTPNSPTTSGVFNSVFSGTNTVELRDASGCLATLDVTVGNNTVVCDPPPTVTLVEATTSSLRVSWAAAPTATSGYELFYRIRGTISWNSIVTAQTTATIAGLTIDTDYEFEVRSICGPSIFSTQSSRVVFKTLSIADLCTIPDVTSVTVSQSDAIISWTAVPTALSYEIEYRKVGDAAFLTREVVFAPRTAFTLTNLEPNTDYEFVIRSVCGTVQSSFSGLIAFKTDVLTSCAVPTITRVLPNRTNFAVQWSAVPGATSYVLQWREDRFGQPWTSLEVPSSTLTQTITNLNPAGRYLLRIRTTCVGGLNSAFSPVSTVLLLARESEEAIQSANESADVLSYSVYPNPNKGDFMVRLNSIPTVKEIDIRIYGMDGRLYYQQTLHPELGLTEIPIQLESIAGGVYLLAIRAGSTQQQTRLMVNP